MSKKAPGKHYRKGISLRELFRRFPDDAAAEAWFVKRRWNGKPVCPHCGSDNVQSGAKHHSMPFRCREKECAKRFSVKTGTVMQSSNMGYQVWAIAIFLMTTSLKSVSSMKLHRDLEITQKSAWHLAHRLRKSFTPETVLPMAGPCEVDETYFGGKVRNMSNDKRKEHEGRGVKGKVAVVGMKDRGTKQVRVKVVKRTDAETLQGFVADNADANAKIYTDDAKAYNGLPFDHETVKHSVSEYVREQAHTNGIESFWSMLKRAHKGTFHKISHKHLDRYVAEFAGRHNVRELDTETQMERIVENMEGKKLPYRDLIKRPVAQ